MQFTSTFCELRHNGKSQSEVFFCKLHCSYVASGGLLVYWIIPYGGHQLLHIIVNITTTAIIVIIIIIIIMVTQHIPTMTNSHHGGILSVMMMVGICQ